MSGMRFRAPVGFTSAVERNYYYYYHRCNLENYLQLAPACGVNKWKEN